jgi:hypothetical protein
MPPAAIGTTPPRPTPAPRRHAHLAPWHSLRATSSPLRSPCTRTWKGRRPSRWPRRSPWRDAATTKAPSPRGRGPGPPLQTPPPGKVPAVHESRAAAGLFRQVGLVRGRAYVEGAPLVRRGSGFGGASCAAAAFEAAAATAAAAVAAAATAALLPHPRPPPVVEASGPNSPSTHRPL